MRPPAPDGLLSLLQSRRSAFAVAWRAAEEVAELAPIARSLARAKWTEADIVAALANHPVEPPEDQCRLMAAQAAQRAVAAAAEDARAEVQIVAVVLSEPPRVDVAYSGKTVRLEIKEVGSRPLLRAACLSAFLAAPKLPAPKSYDEWLTASLQSAERIEETEDASDATTERHIVETAIASLPRCEEPRRVRQHRIWLEADEETGETWAYLHQPSLLAEVLRPNHPGMTARRCCELLRDLGWEPAQIRDGAAVLRVWRGKRGDVDDRIEETEAQVASLADARARKVAEWMANGGDNG